MATGSIFISVSTSATSMRGEQGMAPAGAVLAFMMFQRIIVAFFNDGRSSWDGFSCIRFIRSRNLVRVRAVVATVGASSPCRIISRQSPCGTGTPALCPRFVIERRCPILAFFARSGALLVTQVICRQTAHAYLYPESIRPGSSGVTMFRSRRRRPLRCHSPRVFLFPAQTTRPASGEQLPVPGRPVPADYSQLSETIREWLDYTTAPGAGRNSCRRAINHDQGATRSD